MKKDMIIDGINLVKYGITKRGFFVNAKPQGWHVNLGDTLLLNSEAAIRITFDQMVFIGPCFSPTLTTELRESFEDKNELKQISTDEK